MNTARTITIIGAGEETNGAPTTRGNPAIYDAGTPVGRILAAMCDGGDTIEDCQGLTRITIAADMGNSRIPQPADAPADNDMRRTMTQHRGGVERDRGNQ